MKSIREKEELVMSELNGKRIDTSYCELLSDGRTLLSIVTEDGFVPNTVCASATWFNIKGMAPKEQEGNSVTNSVG